MIQNSFRHFLHKRGRRLSPGFGLNRSSIDSSFFFFFFLVLQTVNTKRRRRRSTVLGTDVEYRNYKPTTRKNISSLLIKMPPKNHL